MDAKDLTSQQVRCIKWILKNKVGCIATECGSGKTVMGLTAYIGARKAGLDGKALIVSTPMGVKETWAVEHNKWEHLKSLQVVSFAEPNIEKRKKLLDIDADVYCVSYQMLPFLITNSFNIKQKIGFIFADEGSCLKGEKSVFRKQLKQLSKDAVYRIISTATPAPHDCLDYFGLCDYLDGGQCLGVKTASEFHDTYCKAVQLGNKNVFMYKPRNQNTHVEIESKVAGLFYTFKTDTSEVQLKFINVEREISPDSLVKYKALQKSQCLNSIMNDTLHEPMDSALLTNKLCQLANGFVYDDAVLRITEDELKAYTANELLKLASSKKAIDIFDDRAVIFKAVFDKVRRHHEGTPIAVAYHFKHDLEILQKLFPEGVSDDQPNISQRWNAGEIPLLFLQYGRSAKSLNLQLGGNVLIQYSMTFNWENDYQIARRFARKGQPKDKVYVYRLILKNTIDEWKVKMLGKRLNNHKRFQKMIDEIVKD